MEEDANDYRSECDEHLPNFGAHPRIHASHRRQWNQSLIDSAVSLLDDGINKGTFGQALN